MGHRAGRRRRPGHVVDGRPGARRRARRAVQAELSEQFLLELAEPHGVPFEQKRLQNPANSEKSCKKSH